MNKAKKGRCAAFELLVLVTSVFAWNSPVVEADVSREVQIDSSPTGAEVFLLRAGREEPVGTTPLRYKATFHSEISILRLLVRKPGFADSKFEIGAKDKRLTIKLARPRLVALPESLNDKTLRPIQAEVVRRLEKITPGLLQQQQPYPNELDGQIAVVRLDQRIYLHVPVLLKAPPTGVEAPSSAQPGKLGVAIWSQLGSALALSLVKAMQGEPRISGILLDVDYGRTKPGFDVGLRTETKVEMGCAGGTVMRYVYDACATQEAVSTFGGRSTEYRCKAGSVMKPVYDPCATRVPVTRTEFKADPRARVNGGLSRLRYRIEVSSESGAVSAESIGARTNLVVTDSQGNVVHTGSVLAGPKRD